MHQALQILDIVDLIIRSNAFVPGFLHSCLLINRFFFQCTAPLLWSSCGYTHHDAFCEWARHHLSASVHNLAKIARLDHQRAQLYMNLVRWIKFNGCLDQNVTSARLEWNNLQELVVVEYYQAGRAPLALERLRPLLIPQLRRLKLHLGNGIDDAVIPALNYRCPGLKSFILKSIKMLTRAEKALVNRVDRSGETETNPRFWPVDCLESPFEEHGWDEQAFGNLSGHSTLERISIPSIQDVWVQRQIKCQKNGKSNFFPALTYLHVNCSASILPQLNRITPQLSSISLDLRAGELSLSPSVFLDAPIFTQLSRLSIKLPTESNLDGYDLTSLLQRAPLLTHLSIAKDQNFPNLPWGHNLTDHHVEALASQGRNLKELYLLFLPPGCIKRSSSDNYSLAHYPTNIALEALGRQCTRLERLWLTCDLNWETLANKDMPVLFPQLLDLQIQGHEMRGDLLLHTRETLKGMGQALAERCPKLRTMGWIKPYEEFELYEYVMTAVEGKGTSHYLRSVKCLVKPCGIPRTSQPAEEGCMYF